MATPRIDVFAIPLPLWAHGFEEPEAWLFPPRMTTPSALAFAGSGGVLAATAADVRNAMFPLLDAVWLHTGIAAAAHVVAQAKRLRVVWTERVTIAPQGEHTIVTTFAPGSLDGGLELRIRGPQDREDQELQGSLAQLQRALVEALVTRGFPSAAPPEAPAFCRRPREVPPIQFSAYTNLCERLVGLIGAHPRNAVMEPQKPQVQRETVALAREIAAAAPDSDAAQLAYLTAAIYVHRADNLKRGDRKLALAALRERSDSDDPVHRLAPAILAMLGEDAAAKAEARAALASIGTPDPDPYRGRSDPAAAYRAWLQRVLAR